MNDKYIPFTNHLTSNDLNRVLIGQEGYKETYLESRAFSYLEDAWAVRKLDLTASDRKLSQLSTYVDNDHSNIYRVGNLCIANLYYPFLRKTNGQAIEFYQLPWKPYYDVHYDFNTPTTDTANYASVNIYVNKNNGILSLSLNYDGTASGVFDVGANFIFPLEIAIE